MNRLTENKLVLVVRETRLEELRARFNTASQTRFYVEQLGGDFADYEREEAVYHRAVAEVRRTLSALGRLQEVHRSFLPNFIFGAEDLVIAVGQDGLVANTLKYLRGQLLIGVNPDPRRYDGQLLPFRAGDMGKIVPEVFREVRRTHAVTMALAQLNNGQKLYAVNDLFVGPKSHGSARYTITHGDRREQQSSSGVIISTGLGSTGWFSSLITGARSISAAFAGSTPDATAGTFRFAWDAQHLCFTVREPFPSKTSGAGLVFGRVTVEAPLMLESQMPEKGVIFSDGMETDFLEFNSGTRAEIKIADLQGRLVV